MNETEHFINDRLGWTCKRCSREQEAQQEHDAPGGELPRFFREGEAEEREPRLSSMGLARWKDETQEVLVCPGCGVEERIARG